MAFRRVVVPWLLNRLYSQGFTLAIPLVLLDSIKIGELTYLCIHIDSCYQARALLGCIEKPSLHSLFGLSIATTHI
jgi:hypothetical protein